MASVKALVTVKWRGVERRPGTILHGFDLAEAERLPGVVEIVGGEDDPAAEIVAEPVGNAVGVVSEAEGDDTPPGDLPAQAPGGAPSRVADVMAAFDLLDEADWTVTGRPKGPALKAVLGFKATAAEVDAALKLREAI